MPQLLSVIVTTFSWPQALDAVLRSLWEQTDREFEVVVADDGSDRETVHVVAEWSHAFDGRLVHAWQPDEGFRLARVRNFGALAARGDQLVFLDGDCIVRRDFIASLRRAARPGWFLAGKRVQLCERLSRKALDHRIPVGRWSLVTWLFNGRSDIRGLVHLTPVDRRRPWRPQLPDFAPYGEAYGFLTVVARDDFDAVNGYDLRFVGWGDQDVDLAIRLRRRGLRCGFAGPASTVLHLAHPSRMPPDRPTWWLLQETREGSSVVAELGVRELAEELVSSGATVSREDAAAVSHRGR